MSKLIKILNEVKPEIDIDSNINFIEEGIFDSFDIIELVSEIEGIYGVKIDGLDIIPENFMTIETIEALIKKSGAK